MLNKSAIVYLAGALLASFSVLGATLWLYIAASRPVYEIFSAAVVNTAATLAAATFVGVFDMFFTLQQMRYNRESERRWEELVEQMRQDLQASQAQQEAYRAEQEAYRTEQEAHRAAEREAHRAEREAYRAEQEAYRTEQEAHRAAEREAHRAEQEAYRTRLNENQQQITALLAEQAAYRVQQEAQQVRQEESQQQIAALLAQNQQITARLLELLERRNGSAAGTSD